MPRPILEHEARFDYPQDGDGPITGTTVASTKSVGHVTNKHVQVNLAGAWDVALEGTVDGSNYVTIQSGITSGNTMIVIAPWYRKMRFNVTTVGDTAQFSAVLGGLTVGDWE